MKTPIFEDYFFYLVKLPKFGYHLLVGALLCCIPIAHFFAFGYLYQLTSSIHRNQRLELPEWTNWPQLFQDGLRFSVPWFFFWLFPLILATVLKWGLEAISMDLFGSLFLLCALLSANCLFSAAVYLLHTKRTLKVLLHYQTMIQLCLRNRWQLVIPTCVALTPLLALPQVYGLAYFASALVFLPYCSLLWTLQSSK